MFVQKKHEQWHKKILWKIDFARDHPILWLKIGTLDNKSLQERPQLEKKDAYNKYCCYLLVFIWPMSNQYALLYRWLTHSLKITLALQEVHCAQETMTCMHWSLTHSVMFLRFWWCGYSVLVYDIAWALLVNSNDGW